MCTHVCYACLSVTTRHLYKINCLMGCWWTYIECHIYEKCGSIVSLMKLLLLCCTFNIFCHFFGNFMLRKSYELMFLYDLLKLHCKSLMLVKPLGYRCCLLSNALRGCHDLFIVIKSFKCNFLRGVLTHVVLTISIF